MVIWKLFKTVAALPFPFEITILTVALWLSPLVVKNPLLPVVNTPCHVMVRLPALPLKRLTTSLAAPVLEKVPKELSPNVMAAAGLTVLSVRVKVPGLSMNKGLAVQPPVPDEAVARKLVTLCCSWIEFEEPLIR